MRKSATPLVLTPGQILDGTTSDLNFLTAARSQERIDVVIRLFLSGRDVLD
jgi:hypothetical protein